MTLAEGEKPMSLDPPPGGWGQTIPRKNRRDDLTPAWHTASQDQDTYQNLRLSLCIHHSTDSQNFDASLASQPKCSQLFWQLAAPDN